MKNVIFESENGWNYMYSPNKNMIIHHNLLLKSNKEYYKKKSDFLEEYGFFDDFTPNLISEYDSTAIKSNLANLRMLLIEVTDSCNLNCEYCGYGKLYDNYDQRVSKNQNIEDIKTFIDYLRGLWHSNLNVSYNNIITIGFYGGEPLVAFSIIKEIIFYIESLDISNIFFNYNMTTNGMLLDKYMDYLVLKNFDLLISLDGNQMNNSYRITKTGKESFPVLYRNIKKLQSKFPEYFDDKVNFNSVLHNRNNIVDICNFIKTHFNKVPSINHLNTNGVNPNFIHEFKKMMNKNSMAEYEKERDSNNLNTADEFIKNLDVSNFNNFFESYTNNSYNSYTDLMYDNSTKYFIPTGTCHPFSRKLFLSVNGKIFPCERSGQEEPLGHINNNEIFLNYDYIRDFYSKKYNNIIKKCRTCLQWKNCTLCAYYLKKENKTLICDRYMSNRRSKSFFSKNLSSLENNKYFINKVFSKTLKI